MSLLRRIPISSRARGLSRASIASALIVVLALCMSSMVVPAEAGTYVVSLCRLPNGQASASPQLSPFNNGAFTFYGGPCSTSGGDASASFDPGLSYPFGANAGWSYNAAPNTRISGLSGNWTATSGSNQAFGSPGAMITADGVLVDECFRANGCAATVANKFFGAATLDVTNFTMMVICGGGSGGTCPPGATGATLNNAQLTTLDSSFPVPSALSGPLVSAPGSTKHGSLAYTYQATDLGGGVYRTKVLVDGALVSAQLADPASSTCLDVYTGNASAYDFARKQPCPLNANVAGALNTALVADGTHQLTLQVEDAGGNTSTVLAATSFVFDNAPPAIADLAGQPGVKIEIGGIARAGEQLAAVLGSVSAQSPTAAYEWQRCLADGTSCIAIPGATAATYTLTDFDVGMTIKVRGIVTDQGGATSVTSSRIGPVVARPVPPQEPAPTLPTTPTTPSIPTERTVPVVPRAGGGACNPVCDSAHRDAIITGSTRTRKTKAGQGFNVLLTLKLPGGKPIAGADLRVIEKVRQPGAREHVVATIRTNHSGQAKYAVPSKLLPSTTYTVAYSAELPAGVASARPSSYDAIFSLVNIVQSRVTFAVKPRSARVGSTLRLAGAIKASLFPKRGVVVRYEARSSGGKRAGRAKWTQFHAVRSNAAGAFVAKYQLRGRSIPSRLTMRACAEKDGAWPYEGSCSRSYVVRVRR